MSHPLVVSDYAYHTFIRASIDKLVPTELKPGKRSGVAGRMLMLIMDVMNRQRIAPCDTSRLRSEHKVGGYKAPGFTALR